MSVALNLKLNLDAVGVDEAASRMLKKQWVQHNEDSREFRTAVLVKQAELYMARQERAMAEARREKEEYDEIIRAAATLSMFKHPNLRRTAASAVRVGGHVDAPRARLAGR